MKFTEYAIGDTRWTEESGRQAGTIEALLQKGGHFDEVIQLRRITTLARLVSDALDGD